MTQPDTPVSFSERLQRDYDLARAQGARPIVADSLRETSLAKALAAGLPALRDDDWRYARLRPVTAAQWLPAATADEASVIEPLRAALPDALPGFGRVVFVDGHYCASLSVADQSFSGGQLRHAASGAANTRNGEATNALQATTAERFAWLNDLFATDGAQLQVTGQLQLELLFISTITDTAAASYPRLQVQVCADSQLTLVERHLGSGGPTALTNVRVQVHLQSAARLQHYRVQAMARDAVFMDTLLATLDSGANYALTFINQGAATARSSLRLRLQGDNTQLSVHGVSLTDERCNSDTVIQLEHVGRNSRSEQVLRGVANGRSSIGLASRVDVAASAGGADSRQSLKGLIGAAGAEVNLRPQLEINTDEVKASHGATTGSLDDNTLFYLLSRGIDPETARKLLEWAFIGDVMSHIDIAGLRRQAELTTVSQLGNAAALEALL